MFRITPDLPSHVVGFEVDGTVTKRDVEALYREVERAMGGGRVHLVGEVTGVGGFTLDALAANLRQTLGLVTKLGRVDRYAVVTDTPWIAAAARAEGLVPGLQVRVWPTAEKAQAVAWASEPRAPSSRG